MLIAVELNVEDVKGGRFAKLVTGLRNGKRAVFLLKNVTPDDLKKLSRMCANDGEGYDLIYKQGAIEVPHIHRRYECVRMTDGIAQYLNRVCDVKEVGGSLYGYYEYSHKNLKDFKVGHAVRLTSQVAFIGSLLILLAPLL